MAVHHLPIKTPPPSAEEQADAETKRKHLLFAWADDLLEHLGYAKRIADASSFDELRKIVFNSDTIDIEVAIRDALHPASGKKADHFVGMRAGALKGLLKSRFNQLKKERENELKSGRGTSGTSGGQQRSNWTDDLKLDDKGGVRPLVTNLILFLREHPAWNGIFGFDAFKFRVVVRKRPPWGDEKPDAPWTDHFETLVRVWFQREDINPTLGDVGRAVQTAAKSNTFHPVRDYLNALTWDRTSRLDKWLITYFHAEDSKYVSAVGPRFLISAVARIFEPGCQVDHTLCLEGPQGKAKSKALRKLAVKDEWFADRLSHVSSKDAAQEMSGVWLIEVAEMDALMKATTSSIKSFLTRRSDRFRPPYGRHPIDLPRQCVFAATINPPAGGYLRDPTGSRRIWPVTCHGMIDVEALARDRDQLWAEAVARYKNREKWWLETPALEALATAEQAKRFKADAWREPIEKWIGRKKSVGVAEVLHGALGIAPANQTHRAEIRVANILTSLGFTKYRPNPKGGSRQRRYMREES